MNTGKHNFVQQQSLTLLRPGGHKVPATNEKCFISQKTRNILLEPVRLFLNFIREPQKVIFVPITPLLIT